MTVSRSTVSAGSPCSSPSTLPSISTCSARVLRYLRGLMNHLGVVGAGVQGFNQGLFAAIARPISDVHVFDHRSGVGPAFLQRLSEALPGVRVHQAPSVEALLAAAETVITATTSSEPVLPDEEELLRGRHFVGIGSFKPTMREFPEALFRLVSRVFVDTEHASVESGDLVGPLQEGWVQRERVVPLGRLLTETETFVDPHRETPSLNPWAWPCLTSVPPA